MGDVVPGRGQSGVTDAGNTSDEKVGNETEATGRVGVRPGKRKRSRTVGEQTLVSEGGRDVEVKTESTEATATVTKTKTANKTAKTKTTKTKTKAKTTHEITTTPPRSSADWPPWFRALEATHRALNVVFTICCTRKHLLTTFATIKTAVEANTGGGRPLTEADVAAVAALLAAHFGGQAGGGDSSLLAPGTIHFAYVDERSLQVDVQGAERDALFKTGAGRRRFAITAQAPPADASVGGVTGRGDPTETEAAEGKKQVLFFAFVDEGLRREVAHPKTGAPTRPTRMLRDERLCLPVYGQAQMAKLVETRNRRFAEAANAYLDRCGWPGDAAADPEAALRREAEAFLPVPEEVDGREDSSSHASMGASGDGGSSSESTIPATIPEERKPICEIVDELRASPWYSGQIVPGGQRVFAAQEAVYGELEFLLSQDLVNALYNAKGITRFYAHQAAALNALHAGRHVVVATPTSSGKSLVFQLPVVRALEGDAQARALFVFPTKALAQDQLRSLRELLAFMPGLGDDAADLVATYDGDTPWRDRDAIRETARVLLTNPDMLHASILPHEARWRAFFQHLQFVVVDELHYYNGLLGAHMAYVMRRLRRVCAAVGNRGVRFVSCSATVADPRAHFETIFGVMDWEREIGEGGGSPVQLVDVDGSPAGPKAFLCWNTPFRVPGEPGSGRGSGLDECARLFCELVLRGVRVLAFCRVREQCEKLVGAVQRRLAALGRAACGARVMAYRGGYTAADRRRIEADMFGGRLLGIVATSALELGVDIGALDCVLTWGFPYSLANWRQQTGRAGRRCGRDALAILVGDAFATDQYYMQHPERLFEQGHGALQVDLGNLLVRAGHLQCAAYELPVRPAADAAYLGGVAGLAALCAERLVVDEAGFYHCAAAFRRPHPAALVAIRDADDDAPFAVVDAGRQPPVVLEELEAARAPFTLYDGAIYLHQGQTYLVRDVDADTRLARVERVRVDWTTQQRDYTDVDAVKTEAVRRIGRGRGGTRGRSRARAYLGTIRVTQHVFGYFKVDRHERILDAVQVDAPPLVRYSRGTWLDVPAGGLAVLARRRLHAAAALHAAEHAVLSLLPNVVVSLPGDVRTECKSGRKEFSTRAAPTQRKRPARLTFFDAKGGRGGTGVAAKAFDFVDELLAQALERIEGCACGLACEGSNANAATGCLECVASAHCSEANTVLSKAGAVVVLRSLLGLAIDEARLPMGPEEGIPPGPETIVPANVVPGVREVGGGEGEEEEDEEEEEEEEDEAVLKMEDTELSQ